jgi:leader peptidase (prepilin peptidase) / N-methyltransferase
MLALVPIAIPSPTGLVLGLLLGSLLAPLVGVLTTRPPLLDAKELPSIPFRCDSCREPISFLRSLPIVSFVWLKGKCASCAKPINRWDPAAEVLCVLLCALTGWRVGVRWDLPAHLLVAAVSANVILVDARLHKIATRIIYPACIGLFALLAIATFAPWVSSGPTVRDLLRAIVGGLVASAFLWLLVFIVPTGMGQGDARLVLLLGMLLGWHGWRHVYLGLFAGFILGSVFGLMLIATRRGGRKTQIAFGPYLVSGAMLFCLWPSLVVTIAGR